MEKDILIIGFGSQAKAWCSNLLASGRNVSIYLRENSKSLNSCLEQSLNVISNEEIKSFQTICMLTPDETHLEILENISKYIKQNSTIVYAHGFSLNHFKLAQSFNHLNHVLLAPKSIASEIENRYKKKKSIPAIISFEFLQDKTLENSLRDLAEDLGFKTLHRSSAKHEMIADLLSEQALLCSTLPYSALKTFNLLVENGIDPELAYFECWFELKLIADAMVKLGPSKFFDLISPNALIGSEIGKSLLFDQEFDKKLNDLFSNISTNSFAQSIKDIDTEKIRDEVKVFWNEQLLSKMHEKFHKSLYDSTTR